MYFSKMHLNNSKNAFAYLTTFKQLDESLFEIYHSKNCFEDYANTYYWRGGFLVEPRPIFDY